ncbi:transposase [Kitasatospora sp. NPDC059827]|uniref:transposase n=1 Tax=Kitasatospora sp. NPDC059827 TaxID=3346964 RepID=UPI003659EE0F
MRPTGTLADDEQDKLLDVRIACPDIAQVYDLARCFHDLMGNRLGALLHDWIREAEQDAPALMRSFAGFLRQDLDAVTAGLTLEWRSGKVEGNVNRIKILKRAMLAGPPSASYEPGSSPGRRAGSRAATDWSRSVGIQQCVYSQSKFGVCRTDKADGDLVTSDGVGKVHFNAVTCSNEWIAEPAVQVLVIGCLQAGANGLPIGVIEAVVDVPGHEFHERLKVDVPDPARRRAVWVYLCHPDRVPCEHSALL